MNDMEQASPQAIPKELADRIISEPDRWILFIGSGVSAKINGDYRRVLSEQAKRVCKDAPGAPAADAIREAVQKNNFADLSDALFGSTWDGASFLDADRERNIRLRNEYAEELRTRDRINIRKANEKAPVRNLIGAFRGIILTTCQDDTVEAFWEYENSLPAETIVYTPQLIANSNDWTRWLYASDEEAAYLKSRNESQRDTAILVKLFGSRDKPDRMLLSRQDMNEFYPAQKQTQDERIDSKKINTILFLEKIFASHNILFVGMNLENDWLLGAAEGILGLLRKPPAAGVKRCSLLSGYLDAAQYHIQEAGGTEASNAGDWKKGAGINEDTLLQDQDKIVSLFWLFYNRRPRKLFKDFEMPEKSEKNSMDIVRGSMEYDVLRQDILGFKDNGEISYKWTAKNIRQLAIAANNYSDFYDLRDAIKLAKTAEDEPYETTIQHLLSSRLSEKGLLLHQILQHFGSGFPIGFLQLLPREKYGLKSWRRAEIQLANSGIYVQRHGKQKLYDRLRYADCVMRSAGKSGFQEKICNKIDAIGQQSMYSYFYPFQEVDIENKKAVTEREVDENFTEMFRRLYEDLREKNEEYQQLHSLLQTELPDIVQMMQKLPDPELEWIPGLFYLLLRESRVGVGKKELLEYCESLDSECQERMALVNEEPVWRMFSNVLMLHQAKALIMSQSSRTEDQQAAVNACKEVEKDVHKAQKKPTLWTGEMPNEIFEHRICACFLQSMIFGRMSTIYEIERCRPECIKCAEHQSKLQNKMLIKMKNCLKHAGKLIEGRKWALGEMNRGLQSELERLMGEYYFKRSQYLAESRRFGTAGQWGAEEAACYRKSEKEYKNALAYYNHSPARHWVQCADIMRNMGDLYCQWARGICIASGQEALMRFPRNASRGKKLLKSFVKNVTRICLTPTFCIAVMQTCTGLQMFCRVWDRRRTMLSLKSLKRGGEAV